ncbi:MAG: acyltransferase [Thermodesulfobacteriota bacterium]|nr:acyltransferase [Thermodesulfobacteriota bacterium]
MNRIESVDIFRLIAIIGVVSGHTTPFKADILVNNETYKYLDVIINQILRFAMPFFFIISGYFWGVKIRRDKDIVLTSINMAKRILTIFIAWSIIYLLPINLSAFFEYGVLGPIKVVYRNICYLIEHPIILLMQGTKGHLWFLVALFFALVLSAIFVNKKRIMFLVLLSSSLYIIGVLAKAYTNTPIGIEINFNTRNGPFFSTLPFVTGYIMSGLNTHTKWLLYGSVVFFLGTFLHFIEIYTLMVAFATSPKQEYVIGTYFMGLGVSMIALSNHPALKNQLLSQFGQLTLGIYAVHLIFVDLLRPIDKYSDSILWELSYMLLAVILSISTSFFLSKNRFLKGIFV